MPTQPRDLSSSYDRADTRMCTYAARYLSAMRARYVKERYDKQTAVYHCCFSS